MLDELVDTEYLDCWYELRTEANNGMGLAPVPWGKIQDYMDREQVPEKQRKFYHKVIRLIDTKFLEYENAKEKSKQNQTKPKKMSRGNG